jgi:hypothetical protein
MSTNNTPNISFSQKPKRKSRWRIYFWGFVAALWALAAVWIYFPPPAQIVESVYTRGLYRLIVGVLTPLTERISFSLALVIVTAIILGFPLLWALVWIFKRRVRGKSHWSGLAWGLKVLVVLPVLVFWWFVIFWGAGYQRLPAEARLELDDTAVTDQESTTLRADLLKVIRRDVVPPGHRDVPAALSAISEAMNSVILEWDGTAVTLPKGVKATPPGMLLSQGTSGICAPLTLEPHVDGGLPDTAFVYVAAHELGHVAGINNEAEATLIGYVAGLKAQDAFARYAVALDAYLDLVRQLPSDQQKVAIDQLPVIAREDIQKVREAAASYRIDWLRDVSRKTYDQYLKSQGIKEGRKNYSKGISLFTYAWRKGLATVPADAPPALPEPEPEAEAAPAT